MRYCQPDELAELWTGAGLTEVETDSIAVAARYEDFADLWDPFTAGVGPAGSYCASLPDARRDELADSYRRRLGSPEGEFELSARAWVAAGRVEPA
jgi:hypothetical protein